jgi:hypothetical protein
LEALYILFWLLYSPGIAGQNWGIKRVNPNFSISDEIVEN